MGKYNYNHLKPREIEELAGELIQLERGIKLERLSAKNPNILDYKSIVDNDKETRLLVEVNGTNKLSSSAVGQLVDKLEVVASRQDPDEIIFIWFNNINDYTGSDIYKRVHSASPSGKLKLTMYPLQWIEKQLKVFPELIDKYNLQKSTPKPINLSQTKKNVIKGAEDQLENVSSKLKDEVKEKFGDAFDLTKRVEQSSNNKLKTEKFEEAIFQVLNDSKDAATIIRESEFYFQKAVDVLGELKSYQKRVAGLNIPLLPIPSIVDPSSHFEVLKYYWDQRGEFGTGDFTDFLSEQKQSGLIPLYNLVNKFIAHIDYRAWNKVNWNGYKDKRVVAFSNVRQNDWIANILKYCINGFEIKSGSLAPSIENALLYIQQPKLFSNILSNNHRKQICESIFGKSYQGVYFNEALVKYFQKLLPKAVLPENISCLITKILYDKRVTSFWLAGKGVSAGSSSKNIPPVKEQISDDEVISGEDGTEDGSNNEEESNSYNKNEILISGEIPPLLGVEELKHDVYDLLNSISYKDKGRIFGVFGNWGRGKTFLIDEVLKIAKTKDDFISVRFHPWKYQDTPASWAYLYEAFASKYFKTDRKDYFSKKLNEFDKSYRLSKERDGEGPSLRLWMAIIVLTIIACLFFVDAIGYWYHGTSFLSNTFNYVSGGLVVLSGLPIYKYYTKLVSNSKKEAKDIFKKYYTRKSFEHVLGIQAEIEKELESLLRVWLPAKEDEAPNKKILLFVDDIDRCSEKRIITIIDALRVMLETPEISKRVIVIAAVDERVLRRAIQWKYHELITNDHSLKEIKSLEKDELDNKKILVDQLVEEYMDKLFIAGIKLGALTEEERGKVLNAFDKQMGGDREKELIEEPIELYGPDEEPNGPIEEPIELDGSDEEPNGPIEEPIELDGSDEEPVDPIVEPIEIVDSMEEPIKKERLAESELTKLNDLIKEHKNMTPRQIRIFYYRYRLGRNILIDSIDNSEQLTDELFYLLGELLSKFTEYRMTVKDYLEVPLDERIRIEQLFVRNKEKEIEIEKLNVAKLHAIFCAPHHINEELRTKVLSVLEMVKAY